MNRKLQSELKGIIGLLKDFKSEALLPVFEAVVNSIQSQHKASIFLINFDKIVADAKKRHYAFFEKLGVK